MFYFVNKIRNETRSSAHGLYCFNLNWSCVFFCLKQSSELFIQMLNLNVHSFGFYLNLTRRLVALLSAPLEHFYCFILYFIFNLINFIVRFFSIELLLVLFICSIFNCSLLSYFSCTWIINNITMYWVVSGESENRWTTRITLVNYH